MSGKIKKIGWGSLSLFFFFIALILVCEYIYFTIGDTVLALLGHSPFSKLNFISPGIIYIAILCTIPSIILGFIFKNHFGARSGRALSITLGLSVLAWYVGFYVGYSTDIMLNIVNRI